MIHVRRLMESRPMLDRYPDPSIIWGSAGGSIDHMAATQGEGYAFVFLPSNPEVIIDFSRIRGERFRTWWYNPRTGEAVPGREVEGGSRVAFRTPVSGVDWILVIDDTSYDYPPPGADQAN